VPKIPLVISIARYLRLYGNGLSVDIHVNLRLGLGRNISELKVLEVGYLANVYGIKKMEYNIIVILYWLAL
jgi:hypothetical protein